METTFDSNQSDLRNSKQRAKNDFNEGVRAVKDTASDEFKNFVADVEDVIKRVANVSDAEVARVREKVRSALSTTKSGISDSAAALKEQAQQAAKYTDDYVRGSPWQAVGIGAALAAVLGMSIGYFAARR